MEACKAWENAGEKREYQGGSTCWFPEKKGGISSVMFRESGGCSRQKSGKEPLAKESPALKKMSFCWSLKELKQRRKLQARLLGKREGG